MPDFEKTIELLEFYHAQEDNIRKSMNDMLNSGLPKEQKDENQENYEKQIQLFKKNKIYLLQNLVTFPPHHSKHQLKLDEFYKKGNYEKSVFIMTKFPEGNKIIDKELSKVITTVKDALIATGFTPRMACDQTYHSGLWDNVELYLFGCKYGIAIVENKYNNELNPNVTMEWGWMRAMDKKVLYLVEATFDKDRADLSGLIKEKFEWKNPKKTIPSAISKFLCPK